MPRIYRIVLSAEAEANIEEAFLWIAGANEAAALQWYEGLIDAMAGLSKLPLRHPVAPETRLGLVDFEIRQFLYWRSHWKYRVLYAIEKDRVVIVHVRHGARLYLGQEAPEDT